MQVKQEMQPPVWWGGTLTASPDINKQIALQDGASLEHLSRSNRIDGFRFLFFVATDFGAGAFTGDTVHAVEDRGPKAQNWGYLLALTERKRLSVCYYSSTS